MTRLLFYGPACTAFLAGLLVLDGTGSVTAWVLVWRHWRRHRSAHRDAAALFRAQTSPIRADGAPLSSHERDELLGIVAATMTRRVPEPVYKRDDEKGRKR